MLGGFHVLESTKQSPPTEVTQGKRTLILDFILEKCVLCFGGETKLETGYMEHTEAQENSEEDVSSSFQDLKKKKITSKIKALRGLCPQISKYFVTVWIPKYIKDPDMCLQPARSCRCLGRLALNCGLSPHRREFTNASLSLMHSEEVSWKFSGEYLLTTDTD